MFDVAITMGTWSNIGNGHIVEAKQLSRNKIQVTNTVKAWDRTETRILSKEEWLEMWDRMRDNGYSRG